MSDREDDLKIGVKSTAIWFGRFDLLIIAMLQTVFISLWLLVLVLLNLSLTFILSLFLAAGFFVYQQWLIHERERLTCFQAFVNNAWVGAAIWFGLLISY